MNDRAGEETFFAEIEAQIAAEKDAVRRARLRVEEGVLAEHLGDRSRAASAHAAAVDASPDLLAAVRGVRRHAGDQAARLNAIERELRLAGTDGERADLHVARARALEARNESPIEAYRAALSLKPDHDEALAGLEAALAREGNDEALAAMHARLARAWSSDPALVASHLAARGRILERTGDHAGAEEAYREAVFADDRPGLARAGLLRVLLRRGSFARVLELLAEDAEREKDPTLRALRLYQAARLAADRVDDPQTAASLLDKAAQIPRVEPRLAFRILEELVRLLELVGDTHGAARVRRMRIDREPIPAVRALEERRLARDLEALNDLSGAVDALRAARAIEPLDDVALASLDRLLATLGRDEERLALFVEEGTRAQDPVRGARAWVRAASVAEESLGRSEDALRLLRTAWATRPGDEDALDGAVRLLLSGLPARDRERMGAAVDLLMHAAELTTDPALRVAHLEKAASLAEELDPERAAFLYERVLAIAPTRRFAIAALQRALRRVGDLRGFAALLEREAEQTSDVEHAVALRLRAAEVWHDSVRDPERALHLLRRVREARPEHEPALLATLFVLEGLGRAEEALEILRALLVLHERKKSGDVVSLRLAIAEMALRLGRHDEAIEEWRAVLSVDGSHPIAQRDLARTLRTLGRFAEAAEATLPIDPVLAAELFEGPLRDEARAKEIHRALHRDDPVAREGLLRVAERTSDVAVLDEVLASDPIAHADLLLRTARDPSVAARLLASSEQIDHLRMRVEALRRAGEDASDALAILAARTSDVRARRAALFERLRKTPTREDARALFALDPRDAGAVDLLLTVGDDDDRLAALEAALSIERDASLRRASTLRLALLLESRGDARGALARYRAVLGEDTSSPLAIAGALRNARATGDRAAALVAERAAAEIALDVATRVRHLLSAASLAREGGNEPLAITLVEEALGADAESAEAASAATQLLVGSDPKRLLELLHRATFAATHAHRVVPLAREAASLADAMGDLVRACALLERARSLDPRNVGVLVDLGDALRKQGAFAEARRVLEEAVSLGSEKTHHDAVLKAHRALADLFEGPLDDPLRTLIELRAVARLAPGDVGAQRRLAAALGRQNQPVEASAILSSLAASPTLPVPERLAILDQICAIQLAAHDRTAAELALREAVKLDPVLGSSSWQKLEAFHAQHLKGDESLVETLNDLVVDADADASWLMKLADLEMHLGRERGAILHLKMAVKMVPNEVVALLALANAHLAVAEFDEASKILHQLLLDDPTNDAILAANERAFVGMSAREEALLVAELRAWLGHGDDPARFRTRTALPTGPRAGLLDEVAIAKFVAPAEVSKAVIEVARLVGLALPKLAAPTPLATFGVTAKDKQGAKSQHPYRAVIDRYAGALGLDRIDFFVHQGRDPAVAVEPFDPPSLFVPSWLTGVSETEQHFAIARALSRLFLGAYALDKLGPEGLAATIAAALSPFGGAMHADGELTKRVGKALSRDQKRTLETLAGEIKTLDAQKVARALEQTAARVSWLFVGDLGAALTHVRRGERIHVAEVGRAGTTTGELIRFAMSKEAMALRRKLGTTWIER